MSPARNLLGFLISGHVERTAGHAVAATDAVFLVEIDDAVRVLHDGARRRTGFQTARILAVHAAILADQPLEVAVVVFVFGKTHHRPRLRRQVRRIVIGAMVFADFITQVVPFHARCLASLAADAFRHIDQLGHGASHRAARLRRGHRGSGQAPDI